MSSLFIDLLAKFRCKFKILNGERVRCTCLYKRIFRTLCLRISFQDVHGAGMPKWRLKNSSRAGDVAPDRSKLSPSMYNWSVEICDRQGFSPKAMRSINRRKKPSMKRSPNNKCGYASFIYCLAEGFMRVRELMRARVHLVRRATWLVPMFLWARSTCFLNLDSWRRGSQCCRRTKSG